MELENLSMQQEQETEREYEREYDRGYGMRMLGPQTDDIRRIKLDPWVVPHAREALFKLRMQNATEHPDYDDPRFSRHNPDHTGNIYDYISVDGQYLVYRTSRLALTEKEEQDVKKSVTAVAREIIEQTQEHNLVAPKTISEEFFLTPNGTFAHHLVAPKTISEEFFLTPNGTFAQYLKLSNQLDHNAFTSPADMADMLHKQEILQKSILNDLREDYKENPVPREEMNSFTDPVYTSWQAALDNIIDKVFPDANENMFKYAEEKLQGLCTKIEIEYDKQFNHDFKSGQFPTLND